MLYRHVALIQRRQTFEAGEVVGRTTWNSILPQAGSIHNISICSLVDHSFMQTLTSSLVMVRNSPGDVALPIAALAAICALRTTEACFVTQYLISSGMTSITATRGSFSSPL
jgi:hypothetical protein